jgi:hypothetical protein
MAGIVAGSITMSSLTEHTHMRERRQLALELLWWIEGARKAGTLDKVLPATLKRWEEA